MDLLRLKQATALRQTPGCHFVTRSRISRRHRLAVIAAAASHQQQTQPVSTLERPWSTSANGDTNSSTGNGASIFDIDLADVPGLPHHHTSRRGLANKVQLSTYGDCIGNNMQDLVEFLERHIGDAAGSIHMLPCYPSSADRGFAPITYQELDPAQGTWDDLQRLTQSYELMVEIMVNHISPESKQFQDYLQHGDASEYADMFIRWDRVWGEGRPTPEDLSKIVARKPAPPMLRVTLNDGTEVPLWCTFSSQQIDINPFSAHGWAFLEKSLRTLCERGAKMIRLDAFGYVTKKPGTSCFMQAPEVWELLERIKKVAEPYGTQLLCEVHENYASNLALARRGYWCYDFALPLLLLHAMQFQTAEPLRHWLRVCPRRQITVLDTHDGMGIDDIKGLAPLVDIAELQDTVEHCLGCNPNFKYIYKPHDDAQPSETDPTSTNDGIIADNLQTAGSNGTSSTSGRNGKGASRQNGSGMEEEARQEGGYEHMPKPEQQDKPGGQYVAQPHQYNCTYFSACDRDPAAYLLARAIQFFTPGVPMVYYVGMLAGTNDKKLAEETGVGRDINRHRYTMEEAEAAIQQPVVQDLLALCRFRNSFPAFQGSFSLDSTLDAEGGGDDSIWHGEGTYPDSATVLRVGWQQGRHAVQLVADVAAKAFEIRYTSHFGVEEQEEAEGSGAAAGVASGGTVGYEGGAGGVGSEQQAQEGQLVHVEAAIREAKRAANEDTPLMYTDVTSSDSNTDAEGSMEEEGWQQAPADTAASINGTSIGNGMSRGSNNGNGTSGAQGQLRSAQLRAAMADTTGWNVLYLPGLSSKAQVPVSMMSSVDDYCHA